MQCVPIVSSHPRKETVASRSSLSPSFLPPPSGHCPPPAPACLSALCLPLSSFSAIQLSSTAFLAHKGRPKRRRRAAAAKAKAAAAETSLRSTGTGEPSWDELRRQERLKEYQISHLHVGSLVHREAIPQCEKRRRGRRGGRTEEAQWKVGRRKDGAAAAAADAMAGEERPKERREERRRSGGQ